MNIAVILIASAILVAIVLWLVPILQTRKLSGTPEEKFEHENNARTVIAKTLTGMFFFFTLYFSFQSYEVSRQTADTERLSTAITHLSSEKPEIRLGAIYLLERIALDSPNLFPTSIDILSSYVRRVAFWSNAGIQQAVQRCFSDSDITDITFGACECDAKNSVNFSPSSALQRERRPDIQAIMSALSRLSISNDDALVFDLKNTDLRGISLSSLQLVNVNFRGANFIEIDAVNSVLNNSDLSNVVASGALFGGAALNSAALNEIFALDTNFYKSTLKNSDLSDGCFDYAVFAEADLSGAKLEGRATFRKAQFWGANLSKVTAEFTNMQNATIDDADFSNADMIGMYFMTCTQLNLARVNNAKRLPSSLECR